MPPQTAETDDNAKCKFSDSLDKVKNHIAMTFHRFIEDKTIKIVGFNKSDDDYLEILEGTNSMPELDVLKDLQNTNPNVKMSNTMSGTMNNTKNNVSIEKTAPMNLGDTNDYK